MKTKYLVVGSEINYDLNLQLFEESWGQYDNAEIAKNKIKEFVKSNPALEEKDFQVLKVVFSLEAVR